MEFRAKQAEVNPDLDGLGVTSKRGATPEPHHVAAGDWQDDDGQALDDLFEANPQGAEYADAVKWPLYPDLSEDDTRPKVTRLITRSIPIGQNPGIDRALTIADPVQILPADPNRKRLRVSLEALEDVTWSATSPVAGGSWTYTLTSPMSLSAVYYFLANDATVATRYPFFRTVTSGGTPVYTVSVVGGLAASTSGNFSVAHGYGSYQTQFGQHTLPLPYLTVLPAGTQLRITVSGIQAGDQLSSITITENTHFWRIAGEKADVYGAMDLPGDYVYESDCHTGPVWVYAPNGIGQINVQAIAVTS
jgi:hypothetical protein